MAGKRIVIVGGGFGGAAAARTARDALGSDHEVVLLDPQRTSYLCGTFPLLIVGERQPARVSRSLTALEQTGIAYREAAVTALDLDARELRTAEETLRYDYLVLAPGAEYDWDAVPGSRDAYSFYDIDSARRLQDRLADFQSGRVAIAVAGAPYKCPPAPYETAMVIDWFLRERGIRTDAEIQVFIPGPAPMPVAGPEAAARISGDLEARGIELRTDATVTAVYDDGRRAEFADGTSIEADVLIVIPIHRPPGLVRSSPLAGPAGWVPVKPETLETEVADVFVIGDAAMVPMAVGKRLPMAGIFASAQGATVGHNLAAAIQGGAPRSFDGVGHCFIYYSPHEAGMVKGEFLAAEKPKVSLVPPSEEGAREKERFEEDWRSFRI